MVRWLLPPHICYAILLNSAETYIFCQICVYGMQLAGLLAIHPQTRWRLCGHIICTRYQLSNGMLQAPRALMITIATGPDWVLQVPLLPLLFYHVVARSSRQQANRNHCTLNTVTKADADQLSLLLLKFVPLTPQQPPCHRHLFSSQASIVGSSCEYT